MLEQGAELEMQDLNRGLAVEELDRLIGERDYTLFLNPKNELYREKKMKEKPPSRKEALELMAANPNLIRRPITVRGKQMVLGFDPMGLQKLAG